MSKLALDNYTGDSVLKIQAEPSWSSALAWMLTLPAIILMAVYGIRRAKRLLNSEKLMPARRINDAATPTNVADYVRNQLTAKFDEKVVAEIYSRNCTAIPGDLHQRIRSLADDCDQATFAGYDTPIEELKSRAVEIVCELKRVSLNNNVSEDTDNLSFAKSRTASMKSNRPVLLIPRVWPACRIVFTAACLCGAIALWGGVAEPVAETTTGEVAPKLTLTDWQREQLLVEATEAYKIARAEKDAVESRIAYENATQKYQMLIDSGIENSKLYFNVANSLLQSGEFDRAISYYERAKRLNPVSISIRKNLNFATKFSAKSSEQLG